MLPRAQHRENGISADRAREGLSVNLLGGGWGGQINGRDSLEVWWFIKIWNHWVRISYVLFNCGTVQWLSDKRSIFVMNTTDIIDATSYDSRTWSVYFYGQNIKLHKQTASNLKKCWIVESLLMDSDSGKLESPHPYPLPSDDVGEVVDTLWVRFPPPLLSNYTSFASAELLTEIFCKYILATVVIEGLLTAPRV